MLNNFFFFSCHTGEIQDWHSVCLHLGSVPVEDVSLFPLSLLFQINLLKKICFLTIMEARSLNKVPSGLISVEIFFPGFR